MNSHSIVKENQQPLMESYIKDPKLAWVTDVAVVKGENLHDPFHTKVQINEELEIPFRIGVHRAVGGLHDFSNPGDLLCASLAACFESTLRMISNRLGISLKNTEVKVTAEVDVRGTLMVDQSVPVGFQKMTVKVNLQMDEAVNKESIHKLIKGTENCCIIYQTLKQGIPIVIDVNI